MQWIRFIGPALTALAEVAGVIVAIVLLARRAGGGAALALGGFGVLLLSTLCSVTTTLPTVQRLLLQSGVGAGRAVIAAVGFNCIPSALMVLGLALLIVSVAALARKPA
jgi:hypothetical protein